MFLICSHRVRQFVLQYCSLTCRSSLLYWPWSYDNTFRIVWRTFRSFRNFPSFACRGASYCRRHKSESSAKDTRSAVGVHKVPMGLERALPQTIKSSFRFLRSDEAPSIKHIAGSVVRPSEWSLTTPHTFWTIHSSHNSFFLPSAGVKGKQLPSPNLFLNSNFGVRHAFLVNFIAHLTGFEKWKSDSLVVPRESYFRGENSRREGSK